MKRLILPILAALLIWIVIFFLCAVYLSDGLALRFETPPEGGTLRILFDPEGIAAVCGTALLPDGLETEVDIGGNASGICGDMPCLCAISPQHQRSKDHEKLLYLFHSDYLTLKPSKYFYSFTPPVRSAPVWGGSSP